MRIRLGRIGLFGHVMDDFEIGDFRRPNMAWLEGFLNDMSKVGLQEHITLDRSERRKRVFVADQER